MTEAARIHITELREQEGLPFDAATVDALLAAPTAWGWLTDDEQQDRERRRLALLAAQDVAEDYGRVEARDVFAGTDWVLRVGDDALHVGFTADVERHADALRALLPAPEVVRPFAARHTFAALERLPRALRKDPVLRALGFAVRDAAVDVRRNALVVTAEADDLAAAARVLDAGYRGAVVLAPAAGAVR